MKHVLLPALLMSLMFACTPPPAEEAPPAAPPEPAPLEIADNKYIELTKPTFDALMNKDVATFLSNFAEDGLFIFNSGDTLKGKAAATEYWNGRMKVITELKFSNTVWLPVKVNDSQNVMKGNWVLGWSDVMATYTTGKSMTQSTHTLFHYNANDKVDRAIQYLDRAPIMAAMKK